METVTKKEVEESTEEWKQAMLESIDLDSQAKDIKLLQAKSHYRLMKARDIIRNLKIQ
jgi:hypothetical protein